MKIRCIVLCAILGCSFHAALGEVKEESITADQIGKVANPSGKSSEYKLEMKDVTVAQIVAEANKISNANLRADDQQASRKPAIVYDLNVNASTLDDFLDQIARQLNMGIYNAGDSLRINPGYQVGWQGMNRGNRYSGNKPDSAMVNGISVSEMLGDNVQKNRNMSVTITCFAGERGFVGIPKVKVIEAVDEQGRDLAAGGPGPNYGQQQVRPFEQMGISTPLAYLNPASKKLAKFKGEVSMGVPKTYKRVTITGIGDEKVDCTINGVKVTIGPVTKEGNQWVVKIRQPQNSNVRLVEDMRSARVFAETGSAMYLQNNGWGSDGKFIDANARVGLFEQNFGQQTELPKPVAIVWDTVDEVETKTITVEAGDIAIP